jgi:aspartate 4-decarboxylase
VLLNGSGFAGPEWSLRVSLANLDDEAYGKIGEQLRSMLDIAVARWKEAQKTGKSGK